MINVVPLYRAFLPQSVLFTHAQTHGGSFAFCYDATYTRTRHVIQKLFIDSTFPNLGIVLMVPIRLRTSAQSKLHEDTDD